MKKLLRFLKKVDDNLVHISLLAYIVLTSLLPKLPFQHVEYTYIKIRYDDLVPLVIGAIFLLQWIRRKVRLNIKFSIPVLLFWAAVFLSFFYSSYVQNTIAVHNIGLLHSLRRVQYMAIFFIASSVVLSEKSFLKYLKVYLGTLLVVCLYALGQKFLAFPSIQSMNPAYVDGRLLTLNPEDRLNSTFGGHFDLAAYLTFSMPLILGFFFFTKKKRYFLLFILSLLVLLYTTARSSFGGYLVSITAFLLFLRKFKLYALVVVITAILLLITGDMTRRFQQMFQIKTVYVNEQTGHEDIDQNISVKRLPAGGLKIPLSKKNAVAADPAKLRQLALEQALEEARSKGRVVNMLEIQKRADQISKYIKPQRTVLCDISCATRLQLEWPRAIGAFLFNPLLGTGPSSITEATDNDFLRWLGEFGLIGTGLFVLLLVSINRYVSRTARNTTSDLKYIYYAFSFGLLALVVNGLYIDVFEASKVAYNFWLIAGLYVGAVGLTSQVKKTNEKRKSK